MGAHSLQMTAREKRAHNKMAWSLEPHFTLRDFQITCVKKFVNVEACLIGDDMGLGKTVEAIALDRIKRIRDRAYTAKTLIIAPLSVVGVWVKHYAWMLPNMKVTFYDGEGVQPHKARATFLQSIREGDSDVYVVHWDALRLMPELAQQNWFHVIADEAHRAKNRKAQSTLALKKIKPKYKTACTGTPAETRPDDLWSLLNWLYPRRFSSYWKFYNTFVQFEIANGYKKVTGVRNVEELQRQMAPFYIRRLKQEVAKELPDKTFSEIEVSLTAVQRRIYDEMKNDMLAWVGEMEDQPLAAPVVIAKLQRLQQFAISSCMLALKTVYVREEYRERPTFEAHELVDTSEGFPCSQGLWAVDINGKRKTRRVVDPYTGENVTRQVQVVQMVEPSSKIDALMQIIEDNPGHSFVVFTQFREVVGLISQRLIKAKISHGCYTGDTSKPQRDAIIDEFQAGRLRIFVGTIRAGGEGITLTRASKMVFIDRDWSASKNVQAEDREHRIGQKDNVQIIDIVAKRTVDRGRLTQIRQSWGWLKELLGDK